MATIDKRREQLLESSASIESARSMIMDTQRAVFETEQVGFAVLDTLHQQRGVIERTNEQFEFVDANIIESRRVLRRMLLRAQVKRIALYSMAVLLSITILVIIWKNLFR